LRDMLPQTSVPAALFPLWNPLQSVLLPSKPLG
jgi:hypothetical protein